MVAEAESGTWLQQFDQLWPQKMCGLSAALPARNGRPEGSGHFLRPTMLGLGEGRQRDRN